MSRPRVAIDGPAASGKSTTARAVAERLGYRYIDSGALYRAVALKASRLEIEPNDLEALGELLASTDARYADDGSIILDGASETESLRAPKVSELASRLSVHAVIRTWVNEKLRDEASGGGVVMEGRDIGSVVLPDAEVKVFLDAAQTVRAERRHADLAQSGRDVPFDTVEAELSRRDHRDSTRAQAPLTAAGGAIVIDGTDLSFDEQVDAVVDLVNRGGA